MGVTPRLTIPFFAGGYESAAEADYSREAGQSKCFFSCIGSSLMETPWHKAGDFSSEDAAFQGLSRSPAGDSAVNLQRRPGGTRRDQPGILFHLGPTFHHAMLFRQAVRRTDSCCQVPTAFLGCCQKGTFATVTMDPGP